MVARSTQHVPLQHHLLTLRSNHRSDRGSVTICPTRAKTSLWCRAIRPRYCHLWCCVTGDILFTVMLGASTRPGGGVCFGRVCGRHACQIAVGQAVTIRGIAHLCCRAYLLRVPAAFNIKSICSVSTLVRGTTHRSPLTGRPACRRGSSVFAKGVHTPPPGREAEEELHAVNVEGVMGRRVRPGAC